MAPALRGGRDVTRKVRPGVADTALAPLRTMKKIRRRAFDGVLMVQPPSGIAHHPLMMKDTRHEGLDCIGIAPGAAVQTVLPLMRIVAGGINGAHIAMTRRTDVGTDTDHARSRALPGLTRHLAPKRCLRGWVRIHPLARETPVSLWCPTTALAISLDANPNYAANSKGRGKRLQTIGLIRALLYWTLHAMHLPNHHDLLLPGPVHHQVHHRLSHHLPTFPPVAFDPTYRLKWTSTSRHPMTPV